MTLVLDLPDEVEQRLAAKAAARGESMQDYVRHLVTETEPASEAAGERILCLARAFQEAVADDPQVRVPSDAPKRVDYYL